MFIARQDKYQPWADTAVAPQLRVESVVKSFDGHVAVDDVSIDIYRREFFSLLGASGCGKTTLLRMLAGFITPDSGRLAIDGLDLVPLPPYERPLNMMFQSYALFPHMTVEKNVAFGLRRDGISSEETARRVEKMLELVQLSAFANRKPAQLSGGQRQRVALARSLVKRPAVLLLDEPLSALDKKLREATQYELIKIQQQVGITFIMVTHDQEEAMAMSTRIAVMDKGRIIQVGTPAEIYERPNSRFVATFIGSVNLFEGKLVRNQPDGAEIECPQWRGRIRLDHSTACSIGQAVTVAIRPEKVQIAPINSPLELANVATGRVRDVAYLGNSFIYHVVIEGGAVLKITEPNQGFSAETGFAADDEVNVGWNGAAAVVVQQ